ncbi:periplasmic heavy metal sensor [Leptobacterium flavescens]|uniref:Periplasmic heavy metal sensor n=1 Tax=Leptobacterium flavescens TaxID=472055 RepID=A0A6P0ULQ2_9FLAO|nr:periplasmic heavy metal sensor [Leptobacterium flavescens]NER14154.1 periplasmic heavy metal sensor [Leptobacterium flavescens]
MKKNLLLYILILFLIGVNSFFLIKFMNGPGEEKRERRGGPGGFIAKELNFSPDQMDRFHELNRRHHRAMREISDEIRFLKDELFSGISDENVSEAHIDSISALIGEREKAKDIEVFYHFRDILEICDEKQKERFNKIILEALHKRPPPPPGRR